MGLEIRKLDLRDIDEVITLCREAFPHSVKWFAPRLYLKSWWQRFAKIESSEIWIGLQDNQVVGFFVLIVDVASFQKERRSLDLPLWMKIYLYLTAPRLILKKVLQRASDSRLRRSFQGLPGEDEEASANLTWLELIAVSPRLRSRGLGQEMITFCMLRTRELKRNRLKLLVRADNKPAVHFYQKMGFGVMANDGVQLTLMLPVSKDVVTIN